MTVKFTKQITAALFLALFVWSCGDNGTGAEPEEPPVTPSLEVVQPDISFFQNNNPQKTATDATMQEVTHFYAAQMTVTSAAWLYAFGQVYSSFLLDADSNEADYNDGTWVWSYSASYENTTAEYRLTAIESASSTKWAMTWSWDDGETKVTDYTILEGTIAHDESKGNWTFNVLDIESDREIPAFKSSWKVSSDTERNLVLEMYNDTGAVSTEVEYTEDIPSYSMVFTNENSEKTAVLWNTETNVGSISENGDKSCWDENFQDVSCD